MPGTLDRIGPATDFTDHFPQGHRRPVLGADKRNVVVFAHQKVVSREMEKAGFTMGNCFTM